MMMMPAPVSAVPAMFMPIVMSMPVTVGSERDTVVTVIIGAIAVVVIIRVAPRAVVTGVIPIWPPDSNADSRRGVSASRDWSEEHQYSRESDHGKYQMFSHPFNLHYV